jgi:hypothetical protein
MRDSIENFQKKLLVDSMNISSIEEIGEFFEFGNPQKEDLRQLLFIMINCICSASDEATKESLLWSVNQAIVYSEIAAEIDWDPLIPCLPLINDGNKDYIVGLFGFSGKEKYIPLLKEYLHYPNEKISATAQEALSEIYYRNRKPV